MNNLFVNDSSELSISSKSIKDCKDVALFFAEMGIMCSVTENTTVISDNNKFLVENGCRIKIGSHKPDLINREFWKKIKKKFNLDCAHLHVEGKFKGCIYDYIRNSYCPRLFFHT